MKSHLTFLAALLVALTTTSCNKYEDLPSPPLSGGDCEYKKSGFSQPVATTEMNRIAGILGNAQLGSHAVAVKSKSVYVSETKNGAPYRYGYQVVFSCDDLELKYEKSVTYDDKSTAQSALATRLGWLNQGRYVKVLDTYVGSTSYTECDTCCEYVCDTCYDEDGYGYDCNCGDECYDCNCSTYYEYYYEIMYAVVNSRNLKQAAMIDNFQSFSRIADTFGGSNRSLSDTLSIAKRFVPVNSVSGKVLGDWKKLIDRLNTMPATKKKECSKRALDFLKKKKINATSMPRPNSKHFVF